ncbi:MAG: peptidoglycan DD-metalloendopeptidase family protein [Chloroflexi bacterium]|nr:peptidoglycan DD-metalloendopeptidase family protein [Chloroflexota bacterium]
MKRMWGAVFFILLMGGCQETAVESTSLQQAAVAELVATPTLQTALAQPVIEYSESVPAAEMPSFSLAQPQDEGVAEVNVGETAVSNPISTQTAVAPTATALPTASPIPSPTPPHLRYTSAEEHYRFWRPIREGETNWTDKVYPYGGTRGGTLRPHHGVEFYVPAGTEVMAVADGNVRFVGSDSEQIFSSESNFYGNLVIIEHDAPLNGQPVFTLYGHLSELLVVEGQHLFMQQVIARSGATGVADGAHLHFEVRVGDNSYNNTRNPRLWLYPFPDQGVVVGRVYNSAGELLPEVTITLSPTNGNNHSHTTTSYAMGNLNSDPLWQENFVIDDVGTGNYKATVQIGDVRVTQEISVQPYRTTFVDLSIDPPPPTPTPEPTP